MDTLTRAELREELKDSRQDLKAYVAERVGRVEERVDRINGRIVAHDRELSEYRTRLEELDRFRESIDLVDIDDLPDGTSDNLDPPAVVTRRDLKVIVGTVVGIGTIVFAWQEALALFLNFLKASLQ